MSQDNMQSFQEIYNMVCAELAPLSVTRDDATLTLVASMSVDGISYQTEATIDVNRSILAFASVFPFSVPEERRSDFAKAILHVNLVLPYAVYDFHSDTGRLKLRVADCFAGRVLTQSFIHTALVNLVTATQAFLSALKKLATGECSLEEYWNSFASGKQALVRWQWNNENSVDDITFTAHYAELWKDILFNLENQLIPSGGGMYQMDDPVKPPFTTTLYTDHGDRRCEFSVTLKKPSLMTFSFEADTALLPGNEASFHMALCRASAFPLMGKVVCTDENRVLCEVPISLGDGAVMNIAAFMYVIQSCDIMAKHLIPYVLGVANGTVTLSAFFRFLNGQ